MPTMRFNLRLPSNATTSDITNALTRFSRDLEWLLNGNLDERNIKNVKLVGEVTFEQSVVLNGDVILGSGTALGTHQLADSTANDVATLKSDFNQLLAYLRDYNILSD